MPTLFHVLLSRLRALFHQPSLERDFRRREIGIRLALGAPPYQLVNDIYGRAAFGLAAGAAGGVLFALLIRRIAVWLVEFRLPGVIPATAALMILIGLGAAFGPVRRALSVDPNQTLRDA